MNYLCAITVYEYLSLGTANQISQDYVTMSVEICKFILETSDSFFKVEKVPWWPKSLMTNLSDIIDSDIYISAK